MEMENHIHKLVLALKVDHDKTLSMNCPNRFDKMLIQPVLKYLHKNDKNQKY